MLTKRVSWLSFGACCLIQLALASPAAKAASTSSSASSGAQIDVNFFYDTLKDDGSWFNTTEYGDVWQPYIAYKSDSWRPYTDGYWSYTDGGWMFVSNENFGWAVYHYGRWTRLKDIGWAWVPGTDWAPAWVTWRSSNPDGPQVAATGEPTDDKAALPPTDNGPADAGNAPPPPAREGSARTVASENYIGWAPLPPEPVTYGTDYAYGPTVDVDFGIDPYDYCFTDYRSFGSPYIAAVLFDPFRSYDCCERSVNITNIYYNRRGGYRGFYNGGPNYDRFRGVSERPIPQYQLNRAVNAAVAQRDIRAGQFNRINGNTLNVAAPRFSNRNVKNGRVNFTQRGALPVTPVNRGAPASVANDARYKRAQESFKRQGETVKAQGGGRGNPANAPGLVQGGNRPVQPQIATTKAAQRAERQARQQAEAAKPAPTENPAAAGQPGGNRAPGAPTTKAERQAVRQAARANGTPKAEPSAANASAREARQTANAAAAGRREQRAAAASAQEGQAREARRASRQEARQQAAPVRQARVREAAAPRQVAPRQAAPRQAPQAPKGEGGGGGGHREGGGGGEGKKAKKPQ